MALQNNILSDCDPARNTPTRTNKVFIASEWLWPLKSLKKSFRLENFDWTIRDLFIVKNSLHCRQSSLNVYIGASQSGRKIDEKSIKKNKQTPFFTLSQSHPTSISMKNEHYLYVSFAHHRSVRSFSCQILSRIAQSSAVIPGKYIK